MALRLGRRRETVGTRFWAKVAPAGDAECWMWTAKCDKDGYGMLNNNKGGKFYTHRLVWSMFNGPVPAGLCVCHKCDQPSCVNPAHLFLGTKMDNSDDMLAKGRHGNQRKTTCPKGHPYTSDNVYDYHGYRHCRTCRKVRDSARKAAKRLQR